MKTQNFMRMFIGFALMSSLAFAPALTLAKDDEGEHKGEGKAHHKVELSDCLKAFGHLIAPGWIKNNGPVNPGEHCVLPFGIAKKFGGKPHTTPDTTPPVISSILATPRQTEAEIRWFTNERADGTVFYSTTGPVGESSTAKVEEKGLTRDHRAILTGLSASTTYFAIVQSRDAAGNKTLSDAFSFTTLAPPPPTPDTTSPVISNVIAIVSSSTVKVGWKTNEPGTSKVYYSLTTPVSATSTTPNIEDTSLVTSHLLIVPNLTASTTYYMLIESKDGVGNVQRTDEFKLTTANL